MIPELHATESPLRMFHRQKSMKADSEERAEGSRQTSGPSFSPVHPAMFVRLIDAVSSHKQVDSILHRLSRHSGSAQMVEALKHRDKAKEVALHMLGTRRPARALSTLQLAHDVGCKLNTTVYETVAYQVAESSRWELLLSLVEQSRQFIPRSTVRLLNWRLRALIECENFKPLDSVLEDFENAQVKPSRRTYHLLVTGHLRNRDVEKAKSSLRAMTAAGFAIDASTHTAITAVYRHLGPDAAVRAQAMETLEEADDRSGTTILNSLLQWSLDARDIPDAMRILCLFNPEAIDFGRSPDIAAPTRQGDGNGTTTASINPPPTAPPDEARRSYLPPPDQRTYPVDIATFGILLKHFSRLGNLGRVVQIFKHVNASGFVPNDYLIAELVRAHFIAGKNSTAVCIVQEVCKATPVPSRLYHDIGMVDSLDTELLLSVAGATPSTHMFNVLIANILPLYGLKGMRVVLRIMALVGVRADTETTFRTLFYLVNDHGLQPREIPVWISRLQNTNNRPSLRQLNLLLATLLRRASRRVWSGGWIALRDHVRSLDDRDGPPSKFEQRRDALPLGRSPWSKLHKMAQSLAARGAKGDHAYYALRIKLDGVIRGDPQAARQTFQEMLRNGIKPNMYHFSALMEGFAVAGDIKAAREVMMAARNAGVVPNAVMYTILIRGTALEGRPRKAVSLFKEMMDSGIEPDVASVDAAASAYFAVGMGKKARALLTRMWLYFAPFPEELQDAKLLEIARAFRRLDPRCGETTKHHRRLLLLPARSKNLRWQRLKLASAWHKLGRTFLSDIARSRRGGNRRSREHAMSSKGRRSTRKEEKAQVE